MAKWMENFEIGDRVVFGDGYEADYPMSFVLPKGASGTVVGKFDDVAKDMRLEVKLDEDVSELETWDNVLHLAPVDLGLNPGFDDRGPKGLVVTGRAASPSP